MKNADHVTAKTIEPVAFLYDVVVKLEPDGAGATSEPVVLADVIDIYSEAWLETYLRKGRPDVAFDQLSFRLLPEPADDSGRRCSGLVIETHGPDGMTSYRRLEVQALSSAAVRGARRLRAAGRLSPNQSYFYDVVARRRHEPAPAGADRLATHNSRSAVRHTPLAYLQIPLQTLKERARTVGSTAGWLPIFYGKDTFFQAEHFARIGASVDPPVESGAVILGVPCACPDTGEFFVVATEAIELAESVQAQMSLFYTGITWANIQAALNARRGSPIGRTLRIVGQCHGHNFRPNWTGDRCAGCAEKHACRLDNAFVSEDDLVWSRCVFARQPWAFCHIFGRDLRAESVNRMYGFRNGRLVERGFYLVDELPPSWSEICLTELHKT